MTAFLHTFTVIVLSLAMALAVAHALEMPGKMRLSREDYFTVQRIYYPGFTIGGISEPVGAITALVLVLLTPVASTAFWLILAAFLGLVGMQAVYWVVVHPVNSAWLVGEHLGTYGAAFFQRGTARPGNEDGAWTSLRDRWEYGHLVRAVLASFSFFVVLVTKP